MSQRLPVECVISLANLNDRRRYSLILYESKGSILRHTNTTMLCLSHYLTNYKKTRLLLNEATHIVVYPMATSFHALGYLLKTHVGMTKDDVQDLKKNGRWTCIMKNYPQYMISSHKARILNH